MAGAQGIRAGRAFVELFANDKRLVRGLKSASAKLKAWGAGVTAMGAKIFAVGAGVLGPLLASVKQFMESAAALSRMENNTKKAALATARNTKRLLQEAQHGGVVFT